MAGAQKPKKRRILVGFDGSERASDAIAFVHALSERVGTEVFVAAVVPFEPVPNLELTDYEEAVSELFESIFDRAGTSLDPGSYELLPIKGRSPAKELIQAAAEIKADLLVVGSSHRGPLGRVYPGSVAASLLSGSPCPVCVVPHGYTDPGADSFRKVGVGFDGRGESGSALSTADQLAVDLGASLALIGVIEYPAPFADEFARPIDLHGFERKRLEEALSTAPQGLQSQVSSAEALDGYPADVLASISPDLDLLVIGSRGYGPIGSVLVGGVGARLVRHAECPVIVVPRRA